ncbi:hypothetical protein [Salinivibrio sp. HTSP]|uniref:hypothetical protein n=1 Tax=Salinivibrio sp. HTSP TaxID=2115977 RepID=UPI000E3189E3|nr:hypothetical protein [Salinivibrio sp. HTSP]
MDFATVTSAYEGLKIGKSLLKSIYDSRVEADAKEKIDEVMNQLGEAQDTLFSMREELFRLQSQNEEYRKRLTDDETWSKKVEQYQLTETAGRAIVYEYLGNPKHFVCPSCIEKKTIQILQDNRTSSGKYRCVHCNAEFPIKPFHRR